MSSRGLMFTMRLSRSEAERFDKLADHHDLSRAELVRFLLKEHERAIVAFLPGTDVQDDDA